MLNLFGKNSGPLKRPPNRELTYEVMALREERWLIDKVFAYEEDAIKHADALAGERDVAKVQVVRERRAKSGTTLSKPIYERARQSAPAKPPITVRAAAGDDAWCEDLEGFYGHASRRLIGKLLRGFLDHHHAIPSELLYDYRLYRKLDSSGSLLQSALHRAAKLQAERRGLAVRERQDALDRLAADAVALARELGAERQRPRLGDSSLDGLRRAALRFRSEPFQRDYALRFAVVEALREAPGIGAKLERVLALATDDPDDSQVALLDGLLADCLGSAPVVQDLLGRQPNLGGALAEIAKLATGRHDGTLAGAPESFASLNRLIVTHGLPATRAVLLERLQQELAGERPLMRDDPLAQRQLLDRIADYLLTPDGGYLGGVATAEGLARRARALNLMGGVVALRFKSGEPLARLQQLLAEERAHLADNAKRGFATYALEIIDSYRGDPAALAELAPAFARSGLLADAKAAIAARLAQPAAPAAPAGA